MRARNGIELMRRKSIFHTHNDYRRTFKSISRFTHSHLVFFSIHPHTTNFLSMIKNECWAIKKINFWPFLFHGEDSSRKIKVSKAAHSAFTCSLFSLTLIKNWCWHLEGAQYASQREQKNLRMLSSTLNFFISHCTWSCVPFSHWQKKGPDGSYVCEKQDSNSK